MQECEKAVILPKYTLYINFWVIVVEAGVNLDFQFNIII